MAQWKIKHGDWIDVLRTMEDESVQCCVTSPPYWGLRDYGTGKWEGGSPDCNHSKKCSSVPHGSTLASAPNNSNHEREGWRGGVCGKCGAINVDRQLGLERTPELYITRAVEGFREVRRILRKDGTLWLNIGDSYNAAGRVGHGTRTGFKQGTNRASANGTDHTRPSSDGLKEKDLCGIPWMLAFALRADGWYLRQDIIWAKPNPMPESVTDRCTKSHEYLFLLSKSARYFCDMGAIAEAAMQPAGEPQKTGQLKSEVFKHGGTLGTNAGYDTRNKRSVWEIATSPFPEAHFATFPPKLVEPCILAGCPEGGTVLDPFNGAGTTGLVATRLHRNYIGIELNQEYIAMARRRIEQDAPLFNTQEQPPSTVSTLGRDTEPVTLENKS